MAFSEDVMILKLKLLLFDGITIVRKGYDTTKSFVMLSYIFISRVFQYTFEASNMASRASVMATVAA